MNKINKGNKFLRFLKFLYIKLFRINDTAPRIALGLAIGVFCGILPGTGPIAALGFAFVFRVNRAGALLGGLLTNTWLSVLTFALALKIGAKIFALSWQELQQEWMLLLKDFHWAGLFKSSFSKIIPPVLTGYFIVALGAGILTYLCALIIITIAKKIKRGKININATKQG